MRVTKCDACGTTYTHYKGTEEHKDSNGLIIVQWKGNGTYERVHKPTCCYDLCPDCMRKLAAFLDGEEISTLRDSEIHSYTFHIDHIDHEALGIGNESK